MRSSYPDQFPFTQNFRGPFERPHDAGLATSRSSTSRVLARTHPVRRRVSPPGPHHASTSCGPPRRQPRRRPSPLGQRWACRRRPRSAFDRRRACSPPVRAGSSALARDSAQARSDPPQGSRRPFFNPPRPAIERSPLGHRARRPMRSLSASSSCPWLRHRPPPDRRGHRPSSPGHDSRVRGIEPQFLDDAVRVL